MGVFEARGSQVEKLIQPLEKGDVLLFVSNSSGRSGI
jgi:hypothetical protein